MLGNWLWIFRIPTTKLSAINFPALRPMNNKKKF